MRRPLRPLLQTIAILLAAAGASAVDGVLEIHHACAVHTGCFPGDTAGYPVEIDQPGSYRLTSDLSVAAGGVQGIRLFTHGVSIDLNGFTVQGPVVCTGSGATIDCGSPAVARGINAGTWARVTVRNGGVRGFGSDGIATGERARILDVVAESNAGAGFDVGARSILSGAIARRNGGAGIFLRAGSVADGSGAEGNGGAGITTGLGSAAYTLSSRVNDGIGIQAGVGSATRAVSSFDNESEGVNLGSAAVLADSVVRSNAEGIHSASFGLVHGNAITTNATEGIDSTAGTGYRENTIQGNGSTVAGGSVIDMGANSCDGSTTCP